MRNTRNVFSSRRFKPSLVAALFATAFVLAPAGARAQDSSVQGGAAGQLKSGADQANEGSVTYTFTTINFPGASDTFAYAINDSGAVVGYYTGAGCSQASCGFIEVKGKFTTIECALENATDPFDISNKGEVVGTYSYYGGVHGFIWEANSACADVVDPSGSTSTEAWGVNDSAKIAGFYGTYGGFLDVNGTFTTVDCPGAAATLAYGIGDNGAIVGGYEETSGGAQNGFVYNAGKCTTVDYPDATATSAKGINKSGQISGWYEDVSGAFNGFIKTGSTYQTLDYPDALGTLMFHLNDKGQVAGWYEDSSGAYHGVIATPKSGTLTKSIPPHITSFSPTAGPIAEGVIILGDLPSPTRVTFDGVPATFTAVSVEQINTVVPVGAKTGTISVTTSRGTVTSSQVFTVN
jgi:hypothetical protein